MQISSAQFSYLCVQDNQRRSKVMAGKTKNMKSNQTNTATQKAGHIQSVKTKNH